MFAASKSGSVDAKDPQFNYVTMLLHGDGSGSGNTTVTPFNSDASTNNFNVTINGDARSNNFNPYQAGYYSNYFGGASDYLTMPDNANYVISGDFTAEAWIYPTSFAGTNGNIVLSQWPGGTASNQSFQFYVNSTGKVGLVYGIGGTNAAVTGTSLSCTLNTWNHIAVTRSGTTVRYFVNGALDTTSSTVSGAFNNSTGVMTVGRINASDSGYFSGYISNCRLVVGTALYTAAFTPSTTPLTAVSGTQVLTCQSNRFIDNSSNAAIITLGGTPQVSPAQPFTLPSSVATYGSGYFSGTAGSYLETAYNSALDASTGPFTYEAWLNPSTTTNKQYLGGSVTNAFFAFVGSGTIFVGRNNVAVDFTSNATIKTNQWNHVVIVRNSSNNIAIFINGSREYYAASNTYNYGLASNSLRIGVATTGSSYEYNGYIADVKIAKSALYDPTASTITIPTAQLTAGSAGLLTTQFNGAGNNSGFKDSSQNNFTITRNGNTTQGTFTPYGSNWSNYFDGSGDYLSVADASALDFANDFTVEAWVFVPTTSASARTIIHKADTNVGYGLVMISAGNIEVQCTSLQFNSTSTLPLNQWNHVALVRSGSSTNNVKFYLNGVLDGQGTNTTDTASSVTLGIGAVARSGAAGVNPLNGYISNVRTVASAVYTSAFTPSTTPLTAITNTSLLTCQSNRFIDNSTNNFTITKNGDTSVQRFSPFSPTTAYSTSVIGGSGYFDGSGDYLRITSATALTLGSGDFCIEMWIYPTAGGSNPLIWGEGPDVGSNNMNIHYNISGNGTIQVYIDAFSGSSVMQSSAISQNTWTHVAVTRSGSTFRLFINGTQSSTYSNAGSVNSGDLRIGASYVGYICDSRTIKGSAVYTSAFTPPTAPLTAISGTSLLLSNTNAGILDNAMMNDLETVGNAQISTSVKKYGTGSMYFDGTGDWLQAAGSPNPIRAFNTGDFTVEMWVYPTQLTSSTDYNIIDFRSGGTTTGFRIGINGSTIPYVAAVGGILNGSFTFSTNTWYHFAVTRSSGTLTIWINGTSAGSNTTTTNFTDSYLLIGSSAAGNIGPYFGYIDDLRITKGVARYTTTFTPPTAAFSNK